MRAPRLLLTLIALLVTAGCDSAALAPDEELVTMFVAAHTVDCMGMYPQQCMLVRSTPTAEWRYFYDEIAGFEYRPGYQYELEVAIREIPNPPEDMSSRAHRLVRIVSLERVVVPVSGS